MIDAPEPRSFNVEFMITEKTRKALFILDQNPGITAARFAALMWSDSAARSRVYNTGNGATRGKGMWLSAGGYLSKLKSRGLVYIWITEGGQNTFRLSSEGKNALASQPVQATEKIRNIKK